MENNNEYLGVGTKVEWTIAKRSKKSVRLSQQFGEVVDFKDGWVVVKMRNNHRVVKHPCELHRTGSGPNLLTRLITGE